MALMLNTNAAYRIQLAVTFLQALSSALKQLLGLGCQRGHSTFISSEMWHQTKTCYVSHFVCLKTLPFRQSHLVRHMKMNRSVRNKSSEVAGIVTRCGTSRQACLPELYEAGPAL